MTNSRNLIPSLSQSTSQQHRIGGKLPISEFSHDRALVLKLWHKSEAMLKVLLDGTKNISSIGRFHACLITLFIRWFIVLLLAAQMGIKVIKIFPILLFHQM